MLKFLSEIKDTKVVTFQEKALIGVVQEYLIDPEVGQLMGIFINDPFSKSKKIILATDIKNISPDIILVDSLESLTDPIEIIRVQEALKINPKIIGEKVICESGRNIGRVKDALLELNTFSLTKLYVVPALGIKKITRELLIPTKQISRIEKNYIVVKDEDEKKRVPAGAAVRAVSN